MTDAPENKPPIQHVYSNVMAAHGSAFDIALDFGHRIENEDPEFAVRVSMSWEHAASMVTVLRNLIESYQDAIGALPDVDKAVGEATSTSEGK
jgi:hypothetical protein